jgi:hypothetical protein
MVLFVSCAMVVGSSATAAEIRKPLKAGQFNPDHETVELFAAIESGRIEARLIPKDETGGKVLITNKTKQPLNLKLPDAFAGVHVLAQIGGGMMGSMTGGVGGGLGQSVGGGGMGGGGMGGGMAGGGAGMFNIAPERIGEFPYNSVCLEHGKPNPRSSMRYELRPIETVAKDPVLIETLKLLTQGVVPQRVAQVLAWHLNNEMSFEQLAAKQVKHLGGMSTPYFSLAEIRTAMQLKDYVAKQLEERANGANVVVPKL